MAAYAAITSEGETAHLLSPVGSLTLDEIELISRRVRLLLEHMSSSSSSSSSSDSLTGLATAASALASEGHLSLSAATLLQAGPLLREVLTTAQALPDPTTVAALDPLHALCNATEDAAARLRTCHGALMSYVSRTPLPDAVDVALVDARNEALAAAKAATEALDTALLQSDVNALAANNKTSADELNALFQLLEHKTGFDITVSPTAASAAAAVDALAAIDPAHTINTALSDVEAIAASISADVSRLTALSPLTLASLGDEDTQPSRSALKTMREVTHSLLLSTDVGHYLTFMAPWQAACSALARRHHTLRQDFDRISRMVVVAKQLGNETAAWAAAFEEQPAKVSQLEAEHGALRKARRVLLQAQADAHSGDESADDTASDRIRAARQRCRRACVARDTAASEVLAMALAYYPEVLVSQRKRLRSGGLPAIVSQRSRDDYDDVKPLERTAGGRHTLLHAKFDGMPCVLKVLPVVEGSSLAHEAGILKQVQHPNIVALLAVFVERDHAYLHMPHASHGDLEHFLGMEAAATVAMLPAQQLQRLARQLCEAVAYLAERSIVHCDIKPANVFVDGERDDDTLRVVLGDFDVSHTATGRTTTLTRAVSGVATHYTPGFAPPEVLHAAAGHPPRVSPAIDVYGLGCVIFAMHMYPRALPEPADIGDSVANRSDDYLFSAAARPHAATPAVPAWAAAVPRDVVQAATLADPRARASARGLLHTRYMLDASGSFAHVAIQRPAYWLHQIHSGSWLEEETEEVRVAVEKMLNATAEPSTHGVGRDSHKQPFQRFKVTRVRRLEHPSAWVAYAAQRRQLADTLLAEGHAPEPDIRPLATETAAFAYPLEGGSLEPAAGEVFLLHGPTKPASIATTGFDVRYAFAGAGAGAMFGRGVYFAESASKADQYVGRDGTRPLTMVVARVLLGRTLSVSATRRNMPFLPEVAEKSTAALPVYYDSIVADMRPQGMRFREVVVGEGSRAYPELFVEYERV